MSLLASLPDLRRTAKSQLNGGHSKPDRRGGRSNNSRRCDGNEKVKRELKSQATKQLSPTNSTDAGRTIEFNEERKPERASAGMTMGFVVEPFRCPFRCLRSAIWFRLTRPRATFYFIDSQNESVRPSFDHLLVLLGINLASEIRQSAAARRCRATLRTGKIALLNRKSTSGTTKRTLRNSGLCLTLTGFLFYFPLQVFS
jgi:hypothetical protein